jgi:hypothetical protein
VPFWACGRCPSSPLLALQLPAHVQGLASYSPTARDARHGGQRARRRYPLTGPSHGGRASPDERRAFKRGVRHHLASVHLDAKTRALLAYAKKLTQEPNMVENSDTEDLQAAGWDERGIYEATALISFFNFSGRLEAASGLPMDWIPEKAKFPEATPGKPTVSSRA